MKLTFILSDNKTKVSEEASNYIGEKIQNAPFCSNPDKQFVIITAVNEDAGTVTCERYVENKMIGVVEYVAADNLWKK